MEKQKILVIDDDIDLCDSLQVIFESAGYVTILAGDRSDGMEKIRAERPDLIVLDVVMGTWQDGFEMSRELKNDPHFRDIPILMLTCIAGMTGIDVKSAAGDPVWLPVDGFLDKPAAPKILLAEVRRLLTGTDTPQSIASVPVRRGAVERPQVVTGQ